MVGRKAKVKKKKEKAKQEATLVNNKSGLESKATRANGNVAANQKATQKGVPRRQPQKGKTAKVPLGRMRRK